MKKIALLVFIAGVFWSCRKDEPEVIYRNAIYQTDNINSIPWGTTGTISNANLSGQGTQTNTAGTTVIIGGTVTVDALAGNGKVIVPEGATLIVNDLLQMSGGSELVVEGTVITKTFTQIGDVYLNGAHITVNGQYQVSGGTTTYLQNTLIKTEKMVIIGDVQAIENGFTQSTNVYSVIKSTGVEYLNRAGGTAVCGPVLFTTNNDQGASQVSMSDTTNAALNANPDLIATYGLETNETLYQYNENCTPLTEFPAY